MGCHPSTFPGRAPIPMLLGSTDTYAGREAGASGTAAWRKAGALVPGEVSPADAQRGWGRRPAAREPRVLHPCGGFCETGWNGRPRRRHICWAGGLGIWDIVFLAGSGGCQKPDKLITSDMGQSGFWRAQAGPPEPPSGDGAAATRKFITQRGWEQLPARAAGFGRAGGGGGQPLPAGGSTTMLPRDGWLQEMRWHGSCQMRVPGDAAT